MNVEGQVYFMMLCVSTLQSLLACFFNLLLNFELLVVKKCLQGKSKWWYK